MEGERLFSLKKSGTAITDMSLGKIVRAAFHAIGYQAEDTGPRILRNTYGRRLLLQGVPAAEVSHKLGLTSRRTTDRISATLPR